MFTVLFTIMQCDPITPHPTPSPKIAFHSDRWGGGVRGVLFPVPSFYNTPFPIHKDNKNQFTIHRKNNILKIYDFVRD